MFKNINKIFQILDHNQKKEFKILILLMFFAMILETIGIGSMIPLINYFSSENVLLLHNINLNHFFLELGSSEKNIIKFKLIFEENPVPITSYEGVLKILFSPVSSLFICSVSN